MKLFTTYIEKSKIIFTSLLFKIYYHLFVFFFFYFLFLVRIGYIIKKN